MLKHQQIESFAEAPLDAVLRNTDLNRAVDTLKSRMIQEAIRAMGSKTKAAEQLGIPRQSLQKMMKRLGLNEEAGSGRSDSD